MTIDKQSRYDRQLRLWGNSGQSNLESSHICLINATSTGSELLKNLVLPGIGEFTIIDNTEVTENSLSGNFFLAHQDLGDNAAKAMVRELKELNSEVVGNAIEDSLSNVLRQESVQFWDSFNIVVVSNYVPREDLDRLKDILWDKNIPLFFVNTIGFYGSLQLILKETTVIETHDPAKFFDLRIDHPWPELQEYVDSINMDDLDDTEHAHVPYIVIFIKALQSWKTSHNNALPKNYQEKKEFRKHVESMSRNIGNESNFIEALKSIHRALQITQIPQTVLELFKDENIKDENINLTTSIFWIYIKALKNFVAKTNKLPLPYAIPDMASDTLSYITLQKIYRDKAINDQKLFTEEVIEILNSIGRTADDINHDSILSFCKNTQFLYVAKGSRELFNQKMISNVLSGSEEEGCDILSIHFALLSFNSYIEQYHTSPNIQNLDEFIEVFKRYYADPSSEIPETLHITFKEILSHPSPDYHNISSLLGGVASQEILKITTSQYTPLDNLYVFDGIHSISEKWKI
ncbi:uncharacterized protein AC631_02941 [Debaryomyces fabryi]|uniref:NEDD8-activating enzyme E1 regulatory subunit n=1 Tax=Debaryomyces fabryi TaxID=58627 RepID=A0A0V1PYH6_9ASCO|nr:uncharacterized protein AC631_02941 [Debaryomyces fabryi]KSA01309.1 hypothetical protein AC631_02941 [Debaryomyces fabryi]CUM46996.1 unnamed protein product [Debaryomyces fabryi]